MEHGLITDQSLLETFAILAQMIKEVYDARGGGPEQIRLGLAFREIAVLLYTIIAGESSSFDKTIEMLLARPYLRFSPQNKSPWIRNEANIYRGLAIGNVLVVVHSLMCARGTK